MSSFSLEAGNEVTNGCFAAIWEGRLRIVGASLSNSFLLGANLVPAMPFPSADASFLLLLAGVGGDLLTLLLELCWTIFDSLVELCPPITVLSTLDELVIFLADVNLLVFLFDDCMAPILAPTENLEAILFDGDILLLFEDCAGFFFLPADNFCLILSTEDALS